MATEYGSKQVLVMRELLPSTLRSELVIAHGFEISKSTPRDILPPAGHTPPKPT